MHHEIIKPSNGFKDTRHVVVRNDEDLFVFQYIEYNDRHLFLSPGEMSIKKLFELASSLCDRMMQKAKVDNPLDSINLTICFDTEDGYHGCDRQPIAKLPSLDDFCRAVEHQSISIKDVNFIRIDTKWFALSFEDGSYVLGIKAPLLDKASEDISWFLQQTVEEPYRSAMPQEVDALLKAHA